MMDDKVIALKKREKFCFVYFGNMRCTTMRILVSAILFEEKSKVKT
jgi:hypothetical protein